jgi:tRNA/tmRNA/rRNA uracil-C5-methylase (TrmA/RlmC/RlmD family)
MVIKAMVAKLPRTIVYVSCDPASLARDARLLEDAGYHLDHLVGYDLFPMTQHVECVARFMRD